VTLSQGLLCMSPPAMLSKIWKNYNCCEYVLRAGACPHCRNRCGQRCLQVLPGWTEPPFWIINCTCGASEHST